ncbi:hypothetical protein LCGC14_2994640 [marine sediment metagenome]|uniref:Uncharacterized protein n=1 Tax=marine sediment metagenome TaxID=412755 RepID=A0A0F8ZAD8_9ZZZZ
MLDIIGHFCFLIFAQGKWQEKYKVKLITEIKKDFLRYAYWDPMYDIPVKLFNPLVKDEDYDVCDLCLELITRFKYKLGFNEGLIRFSHKLIRLKDIERLFIKILTDPQVKKVYFLLLDQNSYIKALNVPKIIKNIKEQQINANKFFSLLEEEKIDYSLIYEIIKY